MVGQNLSDNYKLTVESRLSSLETKVAEIRDNHLQHLQADVTEIKDKLESVNLALAKYGMIGTVALICVQVAWAVILKKYI